MFCKKCGTMNEADMKFCQHCGELLKSTSVISGVTPTGNTIKGLGNMIFVISIVIGSIGVLVIFYLAAAATVFGRLSFIIVISGLIVGALTVFIGHVLKSLVYGYGIIVSHYEKLDR